MATSEIIGYGNAGGTVAAPPLASPFALAMRGLGTLAEWYRRAMDREALRGMTALEYADIGADRARSEMHKPFWTA